MNLRRSILRSLILGLTLISALTYTLVRYQSSLLYLPRDYSSASRYYAKLLDGFVKAHGPLKQLKLTLPDGSVGAAYLTEPKTSAAHRLVVLIGGNAELGLDSMPLAYRFKTLPAFQSCAFLSIDYPGYGNSTGTMGKTHVLDLLAAAIAVTSDRWGYKPPLTLIGHSLGSAVALALASREPELGVDSLILSAPFTSVRAMASTLFFPHMLRNDSHVKSFLEWAILEENAWDNMAALSRLKSGLKLSIVHSKEDEIVPFHMGMALAEQAAAQPGIECKFHALEQGGHNTMFDAAWEVIHQALADVMPDLSSKKKTATTSHI